MIKLNQIRLTPAQCVHEDKECTQLKKKSARILNIPITAIQSLTVMRKALDARKKPDLFYTFSVAVSLTKDLEKKLLRRHADNPNITSYTPPSAYILPEGRQDLMCRPVVVGMGPAGLFCAYYLAKAGFRPIVLERGESVDERRRKVNRFWQSGILDPECNVQFGEGGAGAFSDGKLNTLIRDPDGIGHEVLSCFVQHGAKRSIMYEAKPHLGTDVLCDIVKNIRHSLLQMGSEIRFQTTVARLIVREGRLQAVKLKSGETINTQIAVLAIGHSARDLFYTLHSDGFQMEAKPFAVGVRVQHLQTNINENQYGAHCPYDMPPAEYKLTAKTPDDRGVYTFCMCPGGFVVNASSEPHLLAVNGMSYSDRAGVNANSAVIVTVSPSDVRKWMHCPEDHPDAVLAGVEFQRLLERRAWEAGQGQIPIQRFEDFCRNQPSSGPGAILPETKGAVQYTNIRPVFPQEIGDALAHGIHAFAKKMHCFDDGDALLAAVESRTSSPVRILRNSAFVGSAAGVYPCGEGAGYAGGILSAAIDGIKTARAIAKMYRPQKQT